MNGDYHMKDKTYNSGRWTQGRFDGFIQSALRSASVKWPPRLEVLKEARTEKKTNPKTGRLAQHYECAICLGEFTLPNMNVDHIDPVGTCKTWDTYIKRLFCEKDNLQTICKPCHKEKTRKENALGSKSSSKN